jgi:hypothetical protein
MTTKLVALVLPSALLMLATVPAEAADADVKELFAIDLADYPGKEGRMIEVSYPPGARDMVHRHDAHAFVYVLEGQIVMQLKGKPAVTLTAARFFLERCGRVRPSAQGKHNEAARVHRARRRRGCVAARRARTAAADAGDRVPAQRVAC